MLIPTLLGFLSQLAPAPFAETHRTAGDRDGAAPPLLELQVRAADAGWIRPLLGRTPETLAATVGDFGPTLVPTSAGPEGDLPSGIAFTPDGLRYLVAHRDSRNVLEFDAATRSFTREIPVSGSPLALAISPNGLFAATANGLEDTVSLIDLTGGIELVAIPTGGVPAELAFTPDSGLLATTNFADQSVSVIDVSTGTFLREIQLGGFVGSLSFAPESGAVGFRGTGIVCTDATTALVPRFFDDEVSFCDLSTGAVNGLATAPDPRGLAFAPGANRLAVSHTGSARTVTLLDTVGQSIASTQATAVDLSGPLALQPSAGRVALAIQNAAFVLDLGTGLAGPTLSTASINEFLTTADGQFALGVGFNGSLISFAGQNLVKHLNATLSVNRGAVSPTQPLAVMTGELFAEDVVAVDTNGAAGGLLEILSSGVAPEGDAPRRLAVSVDGTRAVVTNVHSDNASVLDLATGALLGIVPTGDRPSGVAITPDGAKAVVANLDSTFATVIDLATLATVDVPISTRGAEVAISPNGQFAYLSVVSGGDGVWRIDLNTNTVSGGKLSTGNMGGVGFAYGQTSGIELSPDGATLVVCGSFDDVLTLVDTATWSVRASVPTFDFPVRTTFVGPSRFLVSFSAAVDRLALYDLTATGALEVDNLVVGFAPFEFEIDAGRAFGLDASADELEVISLAPLASVASIPLPGFPVGLSLDTADGAVEVVCSEYTTSVGGAVGFAVEEGGQLVRFDAATLAEIGRTETEAACADVAASAGRLAACAIRRDRVVSAPRGPALEADTIEVSTATGGTQSLALDAGASSAGLLYLVVGSASGTSPGTVLDGVLVPLQLDGYTLRTITGANSGAFQSTLGSLDPAGQGSAALVVPPAILSSRVGVELNHAFCVLDPVFATVLFASNPVTLRLAP